MLNVLVAVGLMVAALPASFALSGPLSGSWTATVAGRSAERLEMSMRVGRNSHMIHTLERADCAGLTAAQVTSAADTPVHFELRRDAGTITYDGSFRDGEGAGHFRFAPNREYPARLRDLGVAFEAEAGEQDEQLLTYAILDVSTAFIHSMQAIGCRGSSGQYLQFRIFGVDPAYVRDLAAVGFHDLPAEKLVETKIHGATPDYIRRMRASGSDLPLDGYIESRIFDVSPEFAAAMARAGYADADHGMLTQFRIHGVTTEFVAELRRLGYTRVPADQLVAMRIHGVTPEFIRRVEAAGYHRVPVDKLIQMRIFNIEPEMVKALDDGEK